MRLPFAALVVAALVAPASAHAGTVSLDGTVLVFQAASGQRDALTVMAEPGAVTFDSAGIAAGPGCTAETVDRLRCPSAGVTAIRVLAGDGADSISAGGPIPLFVELGPGDDTIVAGGTHEGNQTAVAVDAGPGNDSVEFTSMSATVAGGPGRDTLFIDALPEAAGPFAIDLGAGDDDVYVSSRAPGMTLSAGDGDDRIAVNQYGSLAVAVTCGPGADRWVLGVQDTAGDGCAPRLAGITPRTVSRVFREGSLSGRASGAVTFRRRVGDQGRPREIIASGAFTARSGTLRVSLTPTRIGRRWLRRDPRLQLFVSVRTRSGGDRGETIFSSGIR